MRMRVIASFAAPRNLQDLLLNKTLLSLFSFIDVASPERARTQGADVMNTRIHGMVPQGRRGSDRGCSLVKRGPGRRARRQAARADPLLSP